MKLIQGEGQLCSEDSSKKREGKDSKALDESSPKEISAAIAELRARAARFQTEADELREYSRKRKLAAAEKAAK